VQHLKGFIKDTPAEGPLRRLWLRMQGWLGHDGALIDQQAFRVMKQCLRRSSNCIDIGCAQGLYLDQMLRLAPEGQHWAFEPIPSLFASLRKRYGDAPNVHLRKVALANDLGIANFYCNASNPGWSGLRRRAYPNRNDIVESIDVRLNRLDQAIPGDIAIDLIKLDVEGAELSVLQGGINLIMRCKPVIIFEYGLGAAEYYEAWPEVMFDLLEGCGLSVAALSDLLAGGAQLDRAEFSRRFYQHVDYYFVALPIAGEAHRRC
jgi:FkbM family methyltransferase